jgi:putative hydrolases of HD superfamily
MFLAAGKLKKIKRRGWLQKAGISRESESVADHCYRTAILGIYFAIELDLDSSKVMRMCLIHDLAESEIGDILPEEKESLAAHRNLEDSVITRIFSSLPDRQRQMLSSDWKELLECQSGEAKIVWELDKLEMAFQSKDYVNAGYEKQNLMEFQQIDQFSSQVKAAFRVYNP